QPAAGPFGDIGIERAVDRVLDLVLELLALDGALGDHRTDRNEVVEILKRDRARSYHGAVTEAANGANVGLRLTPEGVGEEDVRSTLDHRRRLAVGKVHAVQRH